ncbi:hypothetical protein CAMRE0001_2082 [Campylobacter rectus RM3267]|uniref:Uncharacterized protein n=1 Tax=Campylobacter rectus RM3267 TaxID=553218 RepID=B9D4M4_CAMRE|nr:hypothetical protein CAMRE0001_2082 [Campylobacter rectus RM3267]
MHYENQRSDPKGGFCKGRCGWGLPAQLQAYLIYALTDLPLKQNRIIERATKSY